MTATESADVAVVCPDCSGPLVVDHLQDPERVIDRLKRNSDIPSLALRKAEIVTAKAKKSGVIYKCTQCGYRMRQHPPAPGDDQGADTPALDGRAARGALPAAGETGGASAGARTRARVGDGR